MQRTIDNANDPTHLKANTAPLTNQVNDLFCYLRVTAGV